MCILEYTFQTQRLLLLNFFQSRLVYPIYYGTWSTAQKSIVNTFVSGISATTWWNIEKTYHDNAGHSVTGPVALGTAYNDNYSQGKSLSDASIETIVSHAITAGGLPVDANGIYAVLTSGDVTETSGFCSQYCGWHTDGKFSWVMKYQI
jgi:hypothetical protein